MKRARYEGAKVFRASGIGAALVVCCALLVPALVMVAFSRFPALDPVFESPIFHVIVVSAIAGLALAVAMAAAVAAVRLSAGPQVMLALGCVALGVFMVGHGLSTPGIAGRPFNQWVGRFPVLAVASLAAGLSGAAASRGRIAQYLGARPVAAIALPGAIAVGLVAIVAADPTAVWGDVELPGEAHIRVLVLGLCALGFVLTGRTHWRRWRLGRDSVQLALAAGSWLAANAVLSFHFGRLWRLSWWDYHVYLLAGYAAAVYAVGKEYARRRSVEGALASVSMTETHEHIAHGYPEALRALVAAVEAKDRYTHGHSSRVTELSLDLASRLRVGPAGLREIAQGAFLHDIGKIGVPDRILNKTGKLTEDEFAWVREHPVVGADIASHAPSLRHALGIIRHHHEWWDGSGYPDGLSGADIPFFARIVAVADVWDALTSTRSYRGAFSEQSALEVIREGAGTQFDPACVDAMLSVMEARGVQTSQAALWESFPARVS